MEGELDAVRETYFEQSVGPRFMEKAAMAVATPMNASRPNKMMVVELWKTTGHLEGYIWDV
jgi:hypothetical protein